MTFHWHFNDRDRHWWISSTPALIFGFVRPLIDHRGNITFNASIEGDRVTEHTSLKSAMLAVELRLTPELAKEKAMSEIERVRRVCGEIQLIECKERWAKTIDGTRPISFSKHEFLSCAS